jgi:predicted nucleic acid-binding protein
VIRTFVDAAVFLRAIDEAPAMGDQRAAAVGLLGDASRELVTSPLALAQMYAAITGRAKGAARRRAESAARRALTELGRLPTLPFDQRVLSHALDLLARRQLQLWDAVLWASAILDQCDEYASFDAPGLPHAIDGVRFVNPLDLYR